jgi:hypothetical protein
MMEIKSLSYSKIAALLRCPRAFEYRYLLETPAPLKGRMVAGRCYHHALAAAELKWQLFKEIITAEEVADQLSDRWAAEIDAKNLHEETGEEKVAATIVDFGGDDPGKLKDAAIRLAQKYVAEVLPTLNIVYIEKRLETDIDGIPFVGYLDLELAGDIVADHKLRQRRMSAEEAERDIQPSSYALLRGGPTSFQFHQALDIKEPKIEIVETARGEADIEWFRQLAIDAWRQIQSGIFPANPLSWTCGPDCEYYMECRGSWF